MEIGHPDRSDDSPAPPRTLTPRYEDAWARRSFYRSEKWSQVTDNPVLAELSAPNPAHKISECLSIFLAAGDTLSPCLQDPALVGELSAPGHWRLLGVDESRGRAYYARIGHSGASVCGGQNARA
jgi:hypothetical protein